MALLSAPRSQPASVGGIHPQRRSWYLAPLRRDTLTTRAITAAMAWAGSVTQATRRSRFALDNFLYRSPCDVALEPLHTEEYGQ